ncbi:anti-sigma regulatory factor [Nocardioides flavus (ex Wang et al. 2016)]|uniref:Anti-sigma regulatory factor n=1 Tax=Nocardioides flavus (ex Wang et al. 2016) TaxID=2058780 RepID=A0ABQ3HNB1_9ACTN|nr:ATP-binding protein [Nocardioides flavus (ex Wang et al. 2016)]GHE18756.1 anti-sigma regulatory factor [Nocardioides flavus (ex Wang et al. 2016)]
MPESPVAVERIEAPVEPESLDLVQDRLESWLADHDGVSVTDRTRFEMALVEIVANVVEHAFALDADVRGRLLTVELRLTRELLEARLSDNGLPAALDLGAVTMPDEDATSGRGLALAVAAVDELTYDRVDGCNHWRLVCRRAAG